MMTNTPTPEDYRRAKDCLRMFERGEICSSQLMALSQNIIRSALALAASDTEYTRLANSLARDYAPGMRPCEDCEKPVMRGYQCTFCPQITAAEGK